MSVEDYATDYASSGDGVVLPGAESAVAGVSEYDVSVADG